MIKLEVEPYCQTCPDFKADVQNPYPLYNDNSQEPVDYIGDTVIRCYRRNACNAIKKIFLKG